MPHHYELPIASFVAVVLALLPLPWHWKARNVATLTLIAWLSLINIVRGVNSIVWMDSVRIHHRWWCDISSKIIVGVTVALPACSFCITRNLEHIASTRVAITTAADKRRRRIIDLCITLGLPVLFMALHYVVQGHRFDIMEDLGCQPATYISIPALCIVYLPPLVLSFGSLIYAGLALRHFIIRRTEFERHLRDSQSALNTSRYLRLMALAVSEMLWGTTLGLYVLIYNVRTSGLRPWTNWHDVHSNFSRVAIWPVFLIPKRDLTQIYLSWWITPATAALFFLFFGLSQEALEGYAGIFRWVSRVVFRRAPPPPSWKSGYGKGSSLPRFRAQAVASKPDDICFDVPAGKIDLSLSLPPDYTATLPMRKLDFENASVSSLICPGADRLGDVDLGRSLRGTQRRSSEDTDSSRPPSPSRQPLPRGAS